MSTCVCLSVCEWVCVCAYMCDIGVCGIHVWCVCLCLCMCACVGEFLCVSK